MPTAVEKCQKKVNKCVAHNSLPMVDHNSPHRTYSQWQHRQWHTECLSKISFLCRKPIAQAMFCTLTFGVGYKMGLRTPQKQMSKKTFGVIFLVANYRHTKNACWCDECQWKSELLSRELFDSRYNILTNHITEIDVAHNSPRLRTPHSPLYLYNPLFLLCTLIYIIIIAFS